MLLKADNGSGFWNKPEFRLAVVFIALLLFYLAFAYLVYAPYEYYGTQESPRFADPWLERSAVILEGRLLYQDTFTATPPLTNYLLVIPSTVAQWSGPSNPVATLSFMVFFSLFNLFAAWLLLYMAPDRQTGYMAALLYLFNPFTFGNTVLRRQDESILVFFWGLALLFLLRKLHTQSAITIGVTMLVKLTAVLLLPIAAIHSRFNWRYFVIPLFVFVLGWLPFYFSAGETAIFWNFNQQGAEHPFQLGGISMASIWNLLHAEQGLEIPAHYLSWLFLFALVVTLLFILWQRVGVLPDTSLLLTVVLIFVPKLHGGYFSILAFTMVLLLRKPYQIALYMIIAILVLIADFYKFPIRDYEITLLLMTVSIMLLGGLMAALYIEARREAPKTSFKKWLTAAS
jgi:Gpi18-like mannosyltransferase